MGQPDNIENELEGEYHATNFGENESWILGQIFDQKNLMPTNLNKRPAQFHMAGHLDKGGWPMPSTLRFNGNTLQQLKRIVAKISPGGRWVGDEDLLEYLMPSRVKIRCWPNRTIHVQGKKELVKPLFQKLEKALMAKKWKGTT